jgi:hypothetical protein
MTDIIFDDFFISKYWKKVNIENNDDCWFWYGGLNSKGYGVVGYRGKHYLAHRVSYELNLGKIPSGLLVLHKCDQRNCVNPNHLFLGTHKDNMEDMVNKNRSARGDRNGRAKLKESDVKEIIEDYRNGTSSYRMLAERYHVSSNVIAGIVNNVYWKVH